MSNIIKKDELNLTEEQKNIIKNVLCKGATDEEMAYFFEVAKHTGLNPLLHEIWFYKQKKYKKDEKGNRIENGYDIIILTGYAGYLKIAQSHPAYDGMEADIEYDAQGKIKGAWAKVYRKDRSRPTFFYADFKEFYKPGYPLWEKMPKLMLLKCAKAQALREAFNISGLLTMEELGGETINDITPLDEKPKISEKDAKFIYDNIPKEQIKEFFEKYNVQKIIDLPTDVLNEIKNEIKQPDEQQQIKQCQVEEQQNENIEKNEKYEFIPDYNENRWVVIKTIDDIIVGQYYINRDLTHCDCPSKKKPCKHIKMLKEIKSNEQKYNEILKKYPKPTGGKNEA
ncbi:MAG: recombinase RecT [Candidatus Omnitrophica bacterium]|nr:recombinase RecT [Candidatus Omnitrophota bacterium]